MTSNREWLYSLDVADLSDWFDAEHESCAQYADQQKRAIDADCESCDSREKLEADVQKWCGRYAYQADMVYAWLKRQETITEREVKERVNFSLITQTANALFPDYQARVAELQEQVDGLTAERDEYRERLGTCS